MSDIKDDIQEVKKQTTIEKYINNILTSLVLAAILFVYNRIDKVNESMIRLDENVKLNSVMQNEMRTELNKIRIDVFDNKRDIEVLKTYIKK